MEHTPIRKNVFKFPVDVEGDAGLNRIEDIYISDLGYVMISIYNLENKVTVNYICSEIKNILPEKLNLKWGESANLQSSSLP